MRDIKNLISEIIPPADYRHRNGFTNERKIDELSESEKVEVKKELLALLRMSSDSLIADTLAYMKSFESIPILKSKLNSSRDSITKIHLAKAIFKIDSSEIEMKNIALTEFKKTSDEYSLISVFHLLIHFQDPRINSLIREYINDKKYLVAYNARTALGINTKKIVEREQEKRLTKKTWWKIW